MVVGELLVGALVVAGIGTIGLFFHRTRKVLRAINHDVCYPPAEIEKMRRESAAALVLQSEACIVAVQELYEARQTDIEAYTKALKACLQLLHELTVAIQAAVNSSPAHVAARMALVDKLINEMRTILNDATFEDLARCLETLKVTQERVVQDYRNVVAENRAKS